MRFFKALGAAALAALLLGGIPSTLATPSEAAPLVTTPPFAFPVLEGAQLKIEVGYGGPNGDATSYIGNKPAMANFSVWWWASGPATRSKLWLDGALYDMAPAAVGDNDDTNGTLYVVKIPIKTTLGLGDHSYHFEFDGPEGAIWLPATGNFTNLRLDRSDRFLTSGLVALGQQINISYRSTTIPTLREAINRTLVSLDPQLSSHFDTTEGYTYTDYNHYIIEPVAAVYAGKEVFVSSTGASRVRFGDALAFPGNSEPALMQALVTRGALLATGLFNESDLQIWTEAMVMNITPYKHPFLRVQLNDLSEVPGDGPVDGDRWIDIDLWGMQLTPAVAFGSHYGEDYDGGDDAAWDGTIGWPPAADSNAEYVLAPYVDRGNVTAPDGSLLPYFRWESRVEANASAPFMYTTYWSDDPVLFDGLPSLQTVGVDLTYIWEILTTSDIRVVPVFTIDIGAVNQYNATLTVRDAFGDEDSILISFYLRGKTRTTNTIQDISFPEEGRYAMDLRVYFGDLDGFETILFGFAFDPPGAVGVERFPANAPTINLTVANNWCGKSVVTINATDGASPRVSQTFNVTVNCVNDKPVVSGLPPKISFPEDGNYTLGPMSQYVFDADGDPVTWWYDGNFPVLGTYDNATDLLVFTAPPDYSGRPNPPGNIFFTDGIAPEASRSLPVEVNSTNDPPSTAGIGEIVLAEDAPEAFFLVSAYFSDPDNDALTAVVTPFPGIDAGYDSFLRQVWYKPAANFAGDTSFLLVVSDPSLASVTVTVDIRVVAVNDPPNVDNVSPDGYVSSGEGADLVFYVNASDPDTPTLTYTFILDGVSQGQSFTGRFNWTPSYQAAGRHSLKVIVSDGTSDTSEHTWQMQISQTNRPPVVAIVRPSALTFKAGQAIALSADASDPDGDALTFTWTFGGLYQPKTGENITFTSLAAGNYTIRLTASDGALQTSVMTEVEIVFEKPPEHEYPNTTDNHTNPGFILGFEAIGAVVALAAVAAIFVVITRRRR